MKGSICGDIIGSVYEFNNIKTTTFDLFHKEATYTDDTVLTVATMWALMEKVPFSQAYQTWFLKYPDAGYGERFIQWGLQGVHKPYGSWGNGSAMRVGPVGLWGETLDEVGAIAKASAEVTHNHPQGIKGAEAVALAVYLAKSGGSKEEIREYAEEKFGYDLGESVESIRGWYTFDVSCQGTVPPALRCFLEAEDFEEAIRLAISLGGDSDTLACITGSIAEAYFGIPDSLWDEAEKRLPPEMLFVVDNFYAHIRRRPMRSV